MSTINKQSVSDALASVTYVPDRTPESSLDGSVAKAFATLSDYRDGAIYTGYYSGSSCWERHPAGDEIVLALEGSTTLILKIDGKEERVELTANEMVVVPRDTWHRFEEADHLKVLAVTPQPSDHQLEDP